LNTLTEKNNQIKDLKKIFRQYNKKTIIQIENILENIEDRKSFIYLLDIHETEKEITREIIENLIDKTVEINSELIDIIEKKYNSDISSILNEIFSPKNFKSLMIAAVVLGVLFSIATNDIVSLKVLDLFNATNVVDVAEVTEGINEK
jgi:hypothetical protein